MTDEMTTYSKMKIGVKTLEDAILNLGSLKNSNKKYTNKDQILKAIAENDLSFLREVSNYFYRISGIYQRACNYFASMYRYDWYIMPEIYDDKIKEDKVTNDFIKILKYLDNSHIQKICGDIALQVMRNGVYYGYLAEAKDRIVIQELPANYCRCRYFKGDRPAVEFNMRFFDDMFPNVQQRLRVLGMFPKEFSKGYILYKQGKLVDETATSVWASSQGWYLLDPESTLKFGFNNGDMPLFVSAIPALIDLDAAQDLDRRKQMQKLAKILIQKLPLDKNGDLIFDLDEAKDLHLNAVDMMRNVVGVDVLTTFAEVDEIDLSDKGTTASKDDLQKVERTVFNALGLSQNLFNADGNLSLNQSVLNDETTVRYLLLQFEAFFDYVVQKLSTNKKKYVYRFDMLETTQANYKELAKLYKEQSQTGFSRILPQIALGHSQSAIINTAYFENHILHLQEIMLPPLMSSTLNADSVLGKNDEKKNDKTQKNTEDKETGRPEKPDNEKRYI